MLPGALSCFFLSPSLGLQFPYVSQHHPENSLSPGLPLLPSALFWYLHLGLSNFAFLLPSPKISISVPIIVSYLLPKSPLNFSVSGLHAFHPLSNSQQQILVPRFPLVHPVLPPHGAQCSLQPPSPSLATCTAHSTWSRSTRHAPPALSPPCKQKGLSTMQFLVSLFCWKPFNDFRVTIKTGEIFQTLPDPSRPQSALLQLFFSF